MNKRFAAILIEPGRYYSDYAVVDLEALIQLCRCTDAGHAEAIAKALNQHWVEHGKSEKPLALIG